MALWDEIWNFEIWVILNVNFQSLLRSNMSIWNMDHRVDSFRRTCESDAAVGPCKIKLSNKCDNTIIIPATFSTSYVILIRILLTKCPFRQSVAPNIFLHACGAYSDFQGPWWGSPNKKIELCNVPHAPLLLAEKLPLLSDGDKAKVIAQNAEIYCTIVPKVKYRDIFAGIQKMYI